jgi:hypothetical protein
MQSQKKLQQQEEDISISLLSSSPVGRQSPFTLALSPYLADERSAFASASPSISSPSPSPSSINISESLSYQANSNGKFFDQTPAQARSLKISRAIECVLEHNEAFPEGKLAFKGSFLEIVKITNIFNLLGHHYRFFNEKTCFSFTTEGNIAMQLMDDITLIKQDLQTLNFYVDAGMDLQESAFFLNLFNNKVKMLFHFHKNNISLSLEGEQQIVDLFQVLIPANRMIGSLQMGNARLVYTDTDKLGRHINNLLIDIEKIIVRPIVKAYEVFENSIQQTRSL